MEKRIRVKVKAVFCFVFSVFVSWAFCQRQRVRSMSRWNLKWLTLNYQPTTDNRQLSSCQVCKRQRYFNLSYCSAYWSWQRRSRHSPDYHQRPRSNHIWTCLRQDSMYFLMRFQIIHTSAGLRSAALLTCCCGEQFLNKTYESRSGHRVILVHAFLKTRRRLFGSKDERTHSNSYQLITNVSLKENTGASFV